MDRVSGLNANQIAKELQGYKRYSGKTQKEIKEKVGSVNDLRDELRRLEKKHIKSNKEVKYKKVENAKDKLEPVNMNESKIIYLEGVSYTEEDLIKMVKYYHDHVIKPSHIPELNQDMYKEILLNATVKTIKNLCLTNKNYNQLCNTVSFWNEKFTHDHLPHLIHIIKHKNDKGHSLNIPTQYRKLPKNINEWLVSYDKMLKYNDLAKQLLKNIQNSNTFKELTSSVDSHDMLWLPEQMINIIKNEQHYKINIYFTTKNNKFYLELLYAMEEGDDIIIEISKDEFINYLTLLFYYHHLPRNRSVCVLSTLCLNYLFVNKNEFSKGMTF